MAKEIGALVCVPIVLFIAWREWVIHVRTQLPPWCNGVALMALLIISLNWATAVLMDIPELFHRDASGLITEKWLAYSLSHPLGLAAVVFAFALKGRARFQAILASVLLLICWPGGYI